MAARPRDESSSGTPPDDADVEETDETPENGEEPCGSGMDGFRRRAARAREAAQAAADHVQQALDSARERMGELGDKTIAEAVEDVAGVIRKYPISAVAASVFLGFVLGSMARRRD